MGSSFGVESVGASGGRIMTTRVLSKTESSCAAVATVAVRFRTHRTRRVVANAVR